MGKLLDDVVIARQYDPDIGPCAQRPRERRRDGGKSANPDEVVHFGRDEQNLQGALELTFRKWAMQNQVQSCSTRQCASRRKVPNSSLSRIGATHYGRLKREATSGS
jgi:hypothetical protein